MLTKAQMQALGRFAQHDPKRYHVDTGWPNGIVRVYPLTLDGGTWRPTGEFHWTVDPEGVIRTPAGAIAKWDKRGVR